MYRMDLSALEKTRDILVSQLDAHVNALNSPKTQLLSKMSLNKLLKVLTVNLVICFLF